MSFFPGGCLLALVLLCCCSFGLPLFPCFLSFFVVCGLPAFCVALLALLVVPLAVVVSLAFAFL